MFTLNERIRKLRKALDFTQQEFADRLGVSRSNIATYEVGKNNPTDAVISLICREFNVAETWLRTGKGEMFVPEETDAWEEVVKRKGLSDGDRLLIEKYMNLKPTEREVVINYVLSIAADYVPPAQPHEEIVQEAEEAAQKFKEQYISKRMQEVAGSLIPEELRQSVEEAERAYEKNLGIAPKTDLSVSNITDGTGTDKTNLA